MKEKHQKKLFDKPVVLMASLQQRVQDLKKLFDKQESFKNDFVYQAILYELANLKFIIGEKKEEII
jgi:hypothetical protein